jgi:hypothetical protein
MFIKPDDYIILMEDDIYYPLSAEDVKMVVSAGTGVVYVPRTINWGKIGSKGSYDWLSLDRAIDKYLNTDLRLLLPLDWNIPPWFPDSWCLENKTIPNYANPDLMSAIDTFIYDILDHLYDVKDRIQLIYAIPSGGEFLWDGVRPDPFPVSDDVIHNFILGRQKILYSQHGEIWLHLHNFIGGPRNWNNTHLSFLYEVLSNIYRDAFYSIQFAHFSIGGMNFTNLECQSMVTQYNEKYGIKFFVGSDYCEGMVKNFDAAIKQKVRGFFTCPRHLENPIHHNLIEPRMIDIIKETNRKFREVYGNKN